MQLRIHVRVAIDETRRDDMAFCVDHTQRRLSNTSNFCNATVLYREIGGERCHAGSINNQTAADEKIVSHKTSA
jgi:hypothetical protein